MKTVWYEALKAYMNKLLPAVIALALLANGLIFYNSIQNNYLAREASLYNRIVADFKDKPVQQAYDELNALNGELQAYTQLQMLAQDTFGMTQEDIDAQLQQIEEQNPGVIAKYNNRSYQLYSDSVGTDAGLVYDIFNQMNYIYGYKDYITSMTDRMNDMLSVSIFNKEDTFAYRNIIRTPQDFAGLENTPLKLDMSEGVVQSTGFELTDVFMIFIVLLLCIYLISVEKDRKLLLLVKSTRYGRGRAIASKLAVLALSTGAVALLLYGSNILIAQQVFGLGDLGRYVQSISDFRGCTILMTVGQYLLAFLFSKAFVAVFIALLFFTVILLSSNSSFAYAVIAVALAAEWAAWNFIPVTSFINHLKFLNIFGFLDAFSLFANYQNLDVFGQPVNVRLLFCIMVPVAIAALAGLCYFAFSRFRYNEKVGLLSRALDGVRRILARVPGTASLFLHEMYKLLIAQKALLIIVLLFVVQYYAITNFFVVRDTDQIIYQHYLLEVRGKLTDDTRAYIANEQAIFDNAAAILQQAAADLKDGKITQTEYDGYVNRNTVLQERATAFGWITEQHNYLNGISRDKGIDTCFVDPRGYTRLFSLNGYEDDINNQLLLTAIIIACLAAAFAQDNAIRAKKIILACREGRGKSILQKYIACYITALTVAVLVYGSQFFNVCSWYQLADWNAPVQSVMAFKGSMLASVPQFSDFPLNMTIGQYALIVYGIRMLGVMAMVSVVLLVSSVSGSIFVSIFASTALLEIPAIFYMLGFNGAKYFSFVEPLSANMLLASSYQPNMLILFSFVCIVFTVLVLALSKRAYCKISFA
jgi:ABC-type transport system involved in multi-copper enzyme maturation permease subunit